MFWEAVRAPAFPVRFQCCRTVSIYLVLRLKSFEWFTFALAREIFFLVGGGGGKTPKSSPNDNRWGLFDIFRNLIRRTRVEYILHSYQRCLDRIRRNWPAYFPANSFGNVWETLDFQAFWCTKVFKFESLKVFPLFKRRCVTYFWQWILALNKRRSCEWELIGVAGGWAREAKSKWRSRCTPCCFFCFLSRHPIILKENSSDFLLSLEGVIKGVHCMSDPCL